MGFHDNVKNLVKQKTSLTLEAFIQSLGLNYGTYHTQRKAGNLPRADEALAIAQALGVTVEGLVSGENPDSSSSYLDALKSIRDIANKALP